MADQRPTDTPALPLSDERLAERIRFVFSIGPNEMFPLHPRAASRPPTGDEGRAQEGREQQQF
jgi:hypothetical protein